MDYQLSLERAADIAAVAGLLQIGTELGVDRILDSGDTFSAADLAKVADAPLEGVTEYLNALLAAGLVTDTGVTGQFRVSLDYPERRYEAGYVCWALTANNPFIENVREFLADRDSAARAYRRDSRRVAVSSRWIGDRGFYPDIIDKLNAAGVKRVVDLGAGAGGLLIRWLSQDSTRTGIALDISAAACAAAREAARQAGVDDRLEVVVRSIESLVDDSSQINGADAILASFVMHDIVQDAALSQAVLSSCRHALKPNGFMVVVDAVSYAQHVRERKFSALFTYVHASFMNVHLPPEQEWRTKFYIAGFSKVECVPQVVPGGRLFVAIP
ncbi:class I SAM-dependent methyltransferase [Actinocrispum wychmicini]|uniref:O-methyltransferase n=1 Tax=Actinocrispum wychmicini TaxID=1213861 RepID=A0A4R2JV02_9PSEU|nr:class I SAM-dependent methyltransferase [Actinocrispum wychmicini]TCO61168.1 O-methyltransferase [Actinocrispum wychmicini]